MIGRKTNMAYCIFLILGFLVSNVLGVDNIRFQMMEEQLAQQAETIKQLQAVVESQGKTLTALQVTIERETITKEQDKNKGRRLLQSSQDPTGATVAFYAYLSGSEQDPGHHHTIIFDTVQANSGNGYNKHSGAFTAPEDGYYVFSYTVVGYPGSIMPVQLVCNSNIIGSTSADSNSDTPYPSSSSTNVIHLNQNDLCFIRTGTNTVWTVGNIYSSEWSRSSFAGWKL